MLTDIGTITEEYSFLNYPAIKLRESNELPEGMEEDSEIILGLALDRFPQVLTLLTDQPLGANPILRLVAVYSIRNLREKLVRIIHSYTELRETSSVEGWLG